MDNKKYISVEDAIKTTWMILDGLGYAFDENPQLTEAVLAVFDTAQTADVRPVVKAIWKHVQWVVDEEWQEGGYWISRCSNCSIPYHTETPFCPHCGALMEES